jgi:hypothetical protein
VREESLRELNRFRVDVMYTDDPQTVVLPARASCHLVDAAAASNNPNANHSICSFKST